jgi:glycerol-3-phosphate dehydrogenase
MMIPKTSDGRVLFCIPWHHHTLVGTTDTPIEKAVLEPRARESEIDFVLATAGKYLSRDPTRDDILTIFAGIRPLVRSDAVRNTASLSRSHTIEIDASGLLTITGGKWTTYRVMAEEAVDQAASNAGLETRPSQTEKLEIIGPASELKGDLLHPDLPYYREDVVRAVRDEMAITLEDVLARRTRALFLNAKVAIEIAQQVARIMSIELGKDANWEGEQVEQFMAVAGSYRPCEI